MNFNIEENKRFIPVPSWNKYHDWPSVAGLRYLIFNSKSNGFDAVIRKVGRRVLIDEQAFLAWVNQQGVRDEK